MWNSTKRRSSTINAPDRVNSRTLNSVVPATQAGLDCAREHENATDFPVRVDCFSSCTDFASFVETKPPRLTHLLICNRCPCMLRTQPERRKVIGGIDGSHIRLLSSDDEDIPCAYQIFKKYKSIVLLGVVDNSRSFRWFCTGTPGSCTDSGVLRATKFYRSAQEDLAKPVGERTFFAEGSCILGDKAFAEMPWMRTPITLPKNRSERYFNHKHSDMRVLIEDAFGRLKWQFQALKHGLDFKLEDAPIIIDACVVLYNFVLKHEGLQSSLIFVDDAQTRNGTGRARGAETSSEREAEVAYLRDGGFLQKEWGKEKPRADK